MNNKPKSKEEPNKINEENKNQKSTFVNLQKEYDEDRELLELLNGTNKSKLYLYLIIIIFSFKSKERCN